MSNHRPSLNGSHGRTTIDTVSAAPLPKPDIETPTLRSACRASAVIRQPKCDLGEAPRVVVQADRENVNPNRRRTLANPPLLRWTTPPTTTPFQTSWKNLGGWNGARHAL